MQLQTLVAPAFLRGLEVARSGNRDVGRGIVGRFEDRHRVVFTEVVGVAWCESRCGALSVWFLVTVVNAANYDAAQR